MSLEANSPAPNPYRVEGIQIACRPSGTSIVVNPVFTHDIPYRHVANVAADSGGNLVIITSQAVEIGAFGFGGSLVDHVVGSTDRAVSQIKAGISERRDLRGDSRTVRRFTRAWVADGCTVGMLVLFALASVIGDWAPAV
ncbi:hypothetical protein ACFCV9_03285 [Streptomyces sp. NPDC056367]|uniref:hypothetical protein n=1 Tax=Streptomyces sp. NPDC056367 TaxID=3345797 RepID=UPI0035E2745B